MSNTGKDGDENHSGGKYREGSLEAPTRHSVDWKNLDFFDSQQLEQELERVFDVCHGCRRCVSLCNAFPTLFDLVDESETFEVDGVDKNDYNKVVEQCYLCDMCYMSKCPYVPPHEWNIDFPHLMLRAKAVEFKKQPPSLRDKILSNTDLIGKIANTPLLNPLVNSMNQSKLGRRLINKTLSIDENALIPIYNKLNERSLISEVSQVTSTEKTSGTVAIFSTCYAKYSSPELVEDLFTVLEHNQIRTQILKHKKCCGMPKLELGDLESVEKYKELYIPQLYELAQQGWQFTATIPSCVLMFKQELPLLFADDPRVQLVAKHFFDPFEYLMLRHKKGLLNTDFSKGLGNVSYQVACHLRVQNIGFKTKDILELIPQTDITTYQRCSGHDGTYAVKPEYRKASEKIRRPIVSKMKKQDSIDVVSSDCPMAASHIAQGLAQEANIDVDNQHPISLLKKAYGL